ncbi:MAG: preprotein translocase subunit YajC [Flavobacteriales bacterium]|jgi:preprotein translocase subunit YajC|nr:preprotein translocase subunit YajC [Flavobacteriales bacterium]MDG1917593.1 preprotein translocase subunit YajC [Flavobacteriales bacterium]|tara:strand:+ start:500 stop:799 length:300 start_codon:yes stop_codon:yes gene_type:complete
MNLTTIFLQAEAGGNPLIFFVLVFGVFWFFMIRPQVKKQKQERKFREEIKKGDKVITSGGLHGKVVEVADKIVKIDVAKDIVLKIDKSCISAELSTVKE